MDWLCFRLTAALLRRRLSRLRVLLGAAIGGIYAVFSLFLEVNAPVSVGLDLLVCLLMCGIVFSERTAGKGLFLSSFATYFALSVALGGVMTALYHLLNRLRLFELLPADEEGPGVWLFSLLALAGGGLTLWGGRALRRGGVTRVCRVTVTLNGQRAELDGILDTGNLLRDPMSGRPVICADRKALTPILPPSLQMALSGQNTEGLTNTAHASRFRLIPADTATGRGLLAGFIPDRIEIQYVTSGRREKEIVCSVDAVVAVTDLTDTQALVPSALV